MATATQITTGRVRFSYVNAFTAAMANGGFLSNVPIVPIFRP